MGLIKYFKNRKENISVVSINSFHGTSYNWYLNLLVWKLTQRWQTQFLLNCLITNQMVQINLIILIKLNIKSKIYSLNSPL